MTELPVRKDAHLLYNINSHIRQYEKFKEETEDTAYLDRMIERERNVKVGDKHTVSFAAPGCGSVTYIITRIDENGDVYGEYESGHCYEMDIEDVM